MNMIAKHESSISKVLTIAASLMAISFWTAGKARADEAVSPPGTADDGGVVQQVLDLDRSEEQISRAVKPRLTSPQAWNLAERIDVDYAALDREFTSVAGAQPETSDGGPDAAGDLGELANLSGDALDKAYVDREVKAHEAMLGAIDNRLLPAAKSDDVRRSLVELRAEATAHLAQAQGVQHAEWVRATEAQERADISREIGNSGP